MGCRPKFQVLDPGVGSIAIAVMDYFVRSQRAAEMLGHDQSVLADPPGPTYQPPKSARDGDDPVAVVDVTVAGDLPDGAVRLWVAGGQTPLLVRGAEPERFVRS
jgi:hypothetical protein